MDAHLGIDPGANGAFAIRTLFFTILAPFQKNQDGKFDLGWAKAWLEMHRQIHNLKLLATIEKVHAMPGQGVSSMFSFGKNVGQLQGLLCGLSIPFSEVTPQAWQKVMHLTHDRLLDAKTRSVNAAKVKFPRIDFRATARSSTPHSGMVDAILIAEYGFRLQSRAP